MPMHILQDNEINSKYKPMQDHHNSNVNKHDDFGPGRWTENMNRNKKRKLNILDVNLDTALCTTLLQSRQEVGDVIPRVSVQTSAETLLVEVVGNQTNATAQDEETIENTHAHVFLDLFAGEGTAVTHQIHEADSNTPVDVQDQVVLLRGGDSLDSNGVVEQLGGGEVLLDELLDQLHTEVRVVTGLDTVADTRDYNKLLDEKKKKKGGVS